jgi:Flp pilus assembly protein TadD
MQSATVAVTEADAASEATPVTAVAPVTDLSPEALHARLTQANLCRVRQNWTEAVDHSIAVLRAHPGNQPAHSLLGDIYRDQGKLDDAVQWYRMALDLKPNPSDEMKLRQAETERALSLNAAERRRR